MRHTPGNIKTVVMLVLLFGSIIAGLGQQGGSSALKMTTFNNFSLQEKIFVHTDKDFYMAGELMWFKIYVTDAQQHKLLDMSKVCYVELLGKDNRPALQAKIALSGAMGNGSFQLPYSVNSGNYLLRAYTNWMKNEGAEIFFEKNVTIVNALRQPEWPEKIAATKYDLQFFPEGGHLVNGLTGRVAFRLVNAMGIGVAATGAILNNNNDTVAKFSTLKFGMGQFDLKVERAQQYKAIIHTADGQTIGQLLPTALPLGTVMRVNRLANNNLRVAIENNDGAASVSLLAASHTKISANLSQAIADGKASFELTPAQMRAGILTLTIMDPSGRPVAERMVFNKPDLMPLQMQADAASYQSRKKVTISIATGSTAEADCSMAVYLLDSLQQPAQADIGSYLWLQSEFSGMLESPGYYFSDAPDAGAALDNLMLINGWRRFNWNDKTVDPNPSLNYLPELEGHFVQGRLVSRSGNNVASGINAYLSVPAERPLFTVATSGANGELRFNARNFFGSQEIVLQSADSNYRVDIANPFFDKYSNRKAPAFYVSPQQAELVEAHSIQSQVASTYYANKQQNFLYPTGMDTLAFYGSPDDRYYLDDYTRFVTMEEVMREYFSNVRVRKSNDHFSYQVWSTDFKDHFQADPLVLLDGVRVTDIDKLMTFDPLKIKRADVVTHRFVQHNLIHSGIISYHTYQGDLAGFPLDANALIVDYAGMQLQREFYSPVYETTVQRDSRLPDMRNLLFWSPDIKTVNGTASRSFYTADIPGTYVVVLQGLSTGGLAGNSITTFTVNK